MKVRRVLLNTALGAAVLGVGFAAVTAIGGTRTPAPVGQTVKVTRGSLEAVVTATGNVEAVTTTQVNLAGSGGTVTAIYVRAGDQVTRGQRLLTVDDRAEKRDLRTARASLESAKAKLTTTQQSRSAAENRQDRAAIADAEQSVTNAKTSLDAARASYRLDKKQQDAGVDDAEQAVTDARKQLDDDKSDLRQAKNQLAKDQAAHDSAAITTDQNSVSTLTGSVTSDGPALDSAKSARTSAKRTRSATVLKDSQAIDSAKGQVATARRQLDSQRATAAVNAQPARQGAIQDAQAQIDSAQVSVDQAKQALAETVLTAPAAGTVATINAVKGQSSSASSSSATTAGSTSGGSSGGSAGSTGSTSTTSASSSSSGLVVLTDLTHKEVSATVAEVDVTKLRLGQRAQMVFPASGVTATGTVTSIDTDETITNNVVEYGVKVRMDTRSSSVKIGQTASLTIITQRKSNVLVVPTSVLRTVDGRSTVTRRQGQADSPVVVRTGLVGTAGTEITSGLAVGDDVVLPSTGGS